MRSSKVTYGRSRAGYRRSDRFGQCPIAGRGADHEKTAFVFRGLALGDLALAALAYQRASQSRQGLQMDR